MGNFTEEEYLRKKALSLQASLLSRLDEYVEDFPKGQSRDLISTIRLFLAEIEAQIESCKNLRELRLFCPLIEDLAEVLEWLDNAHTAQSPRAYVELLCEISRLLHDGADVLVTPTVESNYLIRDEVPWLIQLSQALSASRQSNVLAKFPKALYHVHFPRVERENILNHALFGHEFGHPIANEFFDAYEAEVRYQEHLNDAQKVVETDPDIADDLEDCEDDTERAELINRIQNTLSNVHKRAVVELVSDAVSAYLFGPSALFASMDFLIREPLDDLPQYDEYYPPTRYRWRLMFEILKSQGFIDALRSLQLTEGQTDIRDALSTTLDYLEGAIKQTSDRDVLQDDAYIRAAYDWLEKKTLPDALEHAKKRVGTAKYDPARIAKEVPPLIDRLQIGVPPSEIGMWPDVTTVDWRSTIIAGWLVALAQTLSKEQPDAKRRERLEITHRLTVKGVEYIFLGREITAFKQQPSRNAATKSAT